MSVTATKASFHDIPQLRRLCDLGKFGRHMSVSGDKVTIVARDYRDGTRMCYTFVLTPSEARGSRGLHLDWTNHYWDAHDYCFIPTDGDVRLADIFSYCDYNAELGRSALRNAGLDDSGLRVLVAEVLDAIA